MRSAIPRAICTFLFGLAAVSGAQAQNQNVPADVKAFVTQYVAAFNAKDVARLESMYHPKSAACITPQNKDYYDGALAVQMRDPIPANYTISMMTPNENNLKALESMGMRWPLKPEQEINIDYQQGDDVGSVVVWFVRENGRLLGDFPCVTDAALKQFRDETPARNAAMAQYKALTDGIKEPLRSELLGMIREHKTSTAIDRYHETSGKDYKTSMFVINALKDEAR
jgi:hypothetical protein